MGPINKRLAQATVTIGQNPLGFLEDVLRHPACPATNPGEKAWVGLDALLSAYHTFALRCGAKPEQIADWLEQLAANIRSGKARAESEEINQILSTTGEPS